MLDKKRIGEIIGNIAKEKFMSRVHDGFLKDIDEAIVRNAKWRIEVEIVAESEKVLVIKLECK